MRSHVRVRRVEGTGGLEAAGKDFSPRDLAGTLSPTGNETKREERRIALGWTALTCLALAMVLGNCPAAAAPGVTSTIQKVYLVSHSHLDIGYTAPPFTVAQQYKSLIDGQISYARSRPAYKYNVEETWQLDEWMKRSTPTQITELSGMVLSGQFGVAGGHSTLHSQKLGVEEMNRFLWHAQQWREAYGWTIDTVFVDDVPSVQWSYPQVLAKSGIKYIVSGQNLFIGGGITQPYASYPFWWQGPDGSRVLVWSARGSYIEAFSGTTNYGVPWGSGSTINATNLTAALKALTDAGYPYDAVMVQYAFDNAASTRAYNAINNWNAANDNPKFQMARPDEFFEYMVGKYSDQLPVREGNWVSNWDYLFSAPASYKISKNAQHLLPAAEAMAGIASALGVGTYPKSEADAAWDRILIISEHSGAGVNGGTAQQISDSIDQYWSYATDIRDATSAALAAGHESLLNEVGDPVNDSIVVYNPLSWERTGLVRVTASARLAAGSVTLTDAVTGLNVPYQTDLGTSQTLFVATAVPPCGYKRFRITSSPPPGVSTSLQVGANYVQNTRYRVQVDSHGYISSLYDLVNSRELVNTANPDDFNRLCPAVGLEGFFGTHHEQPDPTVTNISTGMNGPVAASLRVDNPGHPLASADIVLYEDLDRIDIVDSINRDTYDTTPGSVALSFPLNLAGAAARIDTAAGWHNPGNASETLTGASKQAYGIDHGLDLSLANYGVAFATPDVYIHAFGDRQTPGGIYPPTDPAIFSDFISTSEDDVERDAGPIVELNYSFGPHASGFDPVREGRWCREICVPMQALEVPAGAGGAALVANSLSFFSLDAPNVVITSIKKADYGPGLIVKLQEIGQFDNTHVTLRSDLFPFFVVTRTTPLEADVAELLSSATGLPAEITVVMDHNEILPLRVEVVPRTPAAVEDWAAYR